jgi:hypothetical protein
LKFGLLLLFDFDNSGSLAGALAPPSTLLVRTLFSSLVLMGVKVLGPVVEMYSALVALLDVRDRCAVSGAEIRARVVFVAGAAESRAVTLLELERGTSSLPGVGSMLFIVVD